jgi:Pyridoxamine 5'-phosphate oxidase
MARPMRETADDIAELQRLLDASYTGAGEHLRSIFTEGRRIRADDLCALLTGVQILNLATVTASCEPRVGPVDGLFYRGAFHFGSSESSVRYRHLRERPQGSASHTRGEELAVVVHGRAEMIDVRSDEHAGFRSLLIETYGPDWEEWAPTQGAFYARIDAAQMFTFRFPRG